jgi:hypothetical protein
MIMADILLWTLIILGRIWSSSPTGSAPTRSSPRSSSAAA